MSKTGDDTTRNLEAYLASEHPVVEPIPSKKVEKLKEEKKDDWDKINEPYKDKKEIPKNTESDTYDYSDDKEADSKEW